MKGIVEVDIPICVLFEVVENVPLEGICRFHYESIQVEPPEPANVSDGGEGSTIVSAYHSAFGYFFIELRTTSTFSQLSRHS